MNKIKPCFWLDKTNSYHNNLAGYGEHILETIKLINPTGYKLIQTQKKGAYLWIDLDAVIKFTGEVYTYNPHRINIERFEVY